MQFKRNETNHLLSNIYKEQFVKNSGTVMQTILAIFLCLLMYSNSFLCVVLDENVKITLTADDIRNGPRFETPTDICAEFIVLFT